MKYSVSIDTLVKDIDEQAAVCKRAGVHCVEIAVRDSGMEGYEKYITESAKSFKKNNIEIISFHAPYWPYDISMLDKGKREKFVDELVKNIEAFGKCCPGKIVVIHPGDFVESKEEFAKLIKNAVASMKILTESASKYGLYLAVENMRHGDDRKEENFKDRFGEDPGAILEILEKTGYKRTGVCFDTGHANIAADMVKRLKDCASRVLHTHISDNLGVRDNHFMPEKGKIPWKDFFDVLKRSEYAGCINLEISPVESMSPEEVIIESKKRIEKYIQLE